MVKISVTPLNARPSCLCVANCQLWHNGMAEWRLANRRETVKVPLRVKVLFILIGHLLVTVARLASPGGPRAVVAESLAVKHQLLTMKRAQRRAPNLTSWGSADSWILYAFRVTEALA